MSYVAPLIRPNLTRDKETVGIDSQAACLIDGLIDDYKCWNDELPETLRKVKKAVYVPGLWYFDIGYPHLLFREYKTEAAATSESCDVVVLMSGAWKTWVISYILCDK